MRLQILLHGYTHYTSVIDEVTDQTPGQKPPRLKPPFFAAVCVSVRARTLPDGSDRVREGLVSVFKKTSHQVLSYDIKKGVRPRRGFVQRPRRGLVPRGF